MPARPKRTTLDEQNFKFFFSTPIIEGRFRCRQQWRQPLQDQLALALVLWHKHPKHLNERGFVSKQTANRLLTLLTKSALEILLRITTTIKGRHTRTSVNHLKRTFNKNKQKLRQKLLCPNDNRFDIVLQPTELEPLLVAELELDSAKKKKNLKKMFRFGLQSVLVLALALEQM